MPAVGELVRCTDGRWMIRPPERCPRGHRLGPNRTLVGRQPCSCCGGHMTWACRQCGAVLYAPPIGPRCRVLHGAAPVRSLQYTEREFPSHKVYRRDDRGVVGVSPSSCRAWRSSSSTPVLDVGPVITVPRWCTTAFVTELLTQAPTCSDHDHTRRARRARTYA